MQRTGLSSSEYDLANGEVVTVTLDSIGCGCNTGASFDGTILKPVSTSPDVYRFAAAKPAGGSYVFNYICHFFTTDLPNSTYAVTAQGDGGGGVFAVRTVTKSVDPPAAFSILFNIV